MSVSIAVVESLDSIDIP